MVTSCIEAHPTRAALNSVRPPCGTNRRGRPKQKPQPERGLAGAKFIMSSRHQTECSAGVNGPAAGPRDTSLTLSVAHPRASPAWWGCDPDRSAGRGSAPSCRSATRRCLVSRARDEPSNFAIKKVLPLYQLSIKNPGPYRASRLRQVAESRCEIALRRLERKPQSQVR